LDDLISIVIPVYNVEQYLKKCIESIINQTYKNIEIILVHGISADNCGKICDEYKAMDNRIKVIHKENTGLSDNRNKGIDIATGKYITFVDSDDYVKKDYIEYLYKLIKSENAEMSICQKVELYSDNTTKDFVDNTIKIYNKESFLLDFLYGKLQAYAWAKMYKIELFEKIRYPKGRIFEDIAIIYKLVDICDKIVYGGESKYYYLIRNNSLAWSKFSIAKLDFVYYSFDLCQYAEKYKSLKKAIASYKACICYVAYKDMLNSKFENKQIEDKLISVVKDNALTAIFDKNVNIKKKICILSLYINKNIFKLLCFIYRKYKMR